MRKGLFRTELPGIGECARVDMSAGDAAPYLERSFYELLHFRPPFEQLPSRQQFEGMHGPVGASAVRGY
ncbi:hypothetical protein PYV00_22340 [Novosphingobium sp. H3SJ31-1]|uniref:Uncharacterized protein n=1 Tax=Novosphingobium album (ex Liu et al. 2023) TaxID=3031130 RepID=A0ABT5WX04_9SPHN|nr:hypothetical protein [Novosphingobium album (ex Liu et al. 2023)]